jgi:chromosome segregation ATPase
MIPMNRRQKISREIDLAERELAIIRREYSRRKKIRKQKEKEMESPELIGYMREESYDSLEDHMRKDQKNIRKLERELSRLKKRLDHF